MKRYTQPTPFHRTLLSALIRAVIVGDMLYMIMSCDFTFMPHGY